MRPAAGDRDRDPRPLYRAGQEYGPVDAVVRSGMVYRFSRKRAVDDLQALIEPLAQDPGVGRLAERAVLGVRSGYLSRRPGSLDRGRADPALSPLARASMAGAVAPA